MQPSMSGGDLVIVRDEPAYSVGDVVAYDDPRHGRILHRIIEQRGDRFVVKGDNNAGPDGYQPSEDEIVGELWLHLPAVGGWLSWLEQRVVSIFLLLTAAVLLGGAVWMRRSRLHGDWRPSWATGRTGNREEAFVTFLGLGGQAAVLIIAVVAILSLALAFVAYRADVWSERATTHEYVQQGKFNYSSPAPAEIYPAGAATTGQPIYLDSMSELAIDFHYVLETDLPVDAEAQVTLQALVENDDGWTRNLEMTVQPVTPGTDVHAIGYLQVDRLQETIAAVEDRASEGNLPTRYWVKIAPVIFLDGMIGDQEVHDVFTPELRLLMEPGLLRVDSQGGTGDAFNSTVISTVTDIEVEPNELTIAGATMDVRDARFLSIAGLLGALIAGAGLVYLIRRALRAPEPAQIMARHGSRIITLQAARLRAPSRLVEVTAFDELLRASEFHNQIIIHYVRGDVHYYFVQVGDTVYGYRTTNGERSPELAAERKALSASAD
jgi:signal peptidase